MMNNTFSIVLERCAAILNPSNSIVLRAYDQRVVIILPRVTLFCIPVIMVTFSSLMLRNYRKMKEYYREEEHQN